MVGERLEWKKLEEGFMLMTSTYVEPHGIATLRILAILCVDLDSQP